MPVDPIADASYQRPLERKQTRSSGDVERRKEELSKEISDEELRKTEDRRRLRNDEIRRQEEVEKEIAAETEKGRYIDEVV